MKRKRASLLLIAIIVTGISASGTVGEAVMGVLSPVLEKDIRVPGAMTGQFVAVMFISSSVFSIPAGQLADRFSSTKIALAQLIVSAVAFGSIAAAQHAGWIFVSASAIGVAMALMGPLANRIVVDYLPHRQRASAVAWRSLGPQIGVVLLGVLFATTGDFVYWRYNIIGVATLIAGFAIFSFVALSRREQIDTNGAAQDELKASSFTADSTRRALPIVWWLLPYVFFWNGLIGSVSAYLIYFAYHEIEMSLAVASLSAAVVSGISICARLLWVKFLTPHNAVGFMLLASAATVGAAVLMVASVLLGPVAFWAAAVLFGAFGIGINPVSQVLLVWYTNPRYMGRVSAWAALVRSAGMAGQPFAMSLIVASFGVAASWYVVATCALCAGVTLLAYRMLQGRTSETAVKPSNVPHSSGASGATSADITDCAATTTSIDRAVTTTETDFSDTETQN